MIERNIEIMCGPPREVHESVLSPCISYRSHRKKNLILIGCNFIASGRKKLDTIFGTDIMFACQRL